MTTGEIQKQLFNAVKSKLDRDQSLAEEISKLLNISSGNAYRRIQGEISVPFDELYLMCKHYKLSIDKIINIQSTGIVFHGNYVDVNFNFQEYLNSMMNDLAYMNSFKQKEIIYMCKDLPIFHHYHLREIAAFKRFFWLKSYFEFPGFENKKFRVEDHPDDLFKIEQKILDLYNQMPSVEMWNLENMNIFFRQIDFYRSIGVFETDEDIRRLYDALETLWSHLEEQAAMGYKFRIDDPEKQPMASFRMYFNEVLLGDNSIMVILDGNKMTYMAHSTINFMRTMDKDFNENMFRHIQRQMKRSTLISDVNEKERARFFRIIREKIALRKQSLGG